MATYSYQCSPVAKRPVDTEVERQFIDQPELAGQSFMSRPAAKRLNKILRAGDRVLISAADGATSQDLFNTLRRWDFYGIEIEYTDADVQPGWETFRGSVEKLGTALSEAFTGPDVDTVEAH